MGKAFLAAGGVLAGLFLTLASPSRAADGYDSVEGEEAVEEEPPIRKGMHLRTTPAPAAAAGIPALIVLGAGFVALRRRRR